MKIEQRVLPNARLDDDIGIWEGSIVNEVLYFMFEAEINVGFMAIFFMKVAIFIEVPSGRYEIEHRCGI